MKEKFYVASEAALDINRAKGSSIKIDEVSIAIHIFFWEHLPFVDDYQTELAFEAKRNDTIGLKQRGINKGRWKKLEMNDVFIPLLASPSQVLIY